MVEKLSENFWFIALIAVMIPTNAIIPKAIIETVSLFAVYYSEPYEKPMKKYQENSYTTILPKLKKE